MFETSPPSSAEKTKGVTGKPLRKIPERTISAPAPKSSIRILEAVSAIPTSKPKSVEPGISSGIVPAERVPVGHAQTQGTLPKASTYRVLEAPEKPAEKTGSGSSKASDVLKKARHRFDKFWSKSKDEE